MQVDCLILHSHNTILPKSHVQDGTIPLGQQQICLSRNRLVQKSQVPWIDDELSMCWTRPIPL